MRDVLFLLLTVGFFGLTSLFVVACDRIVGPDAAGDDTVEGGHRDAPAEAAVR